MENEDRDVKLAGAAENAPVAGQEVGAASTAASATTGDTASAPAAGVAGGANDMAGAPAAGAIGGANDTSGAPTAAASVAAVSAEAAAKAATKGTGSELFAWVRDIAIAILIAFVITRFVTPTIVQEHSMQDTLDNHDYLFMYKMAYKFGSEPEYGDIVVFRSDILAEDGSKKLLIKRVIAVGGDTVAVKDGIVYRNGEALDEPYTKDGYTTGAMDETVVPEGTLFLLGDNREVSVDSRSPEVGFVSENRLVGKAIFRLFPFNKIGGIYSNYPGN